MTDLEGKSSPAPPLSLAEYWARRKSKTPNERPAEPSKCETRAASSENNRSTGTHCSNDRKRRNNPYLTPHRTNDDIVRHIIPLSTAHDIVSFVKHRLRASTYGNYLVHPHEKLQKLIHRWRQSQGDGDDIYVEDFISGVRRHCKVHPSEVWRVLEACGGVDDRKNVSIKSIISFVQGDDSARPTSMPSTTDTRRSPRAEEATPKSTGDIEAFLFEEEEDAEDMSYEDVVSDLTRAIRRAEKFKQRTRGQSNREPLIRLIAAAHLSAYDMGKYQGKAFGGGSP